MLMQLTDADSSEPTAARGSALDRVADEQLKPARGIVTAVLIATPVWAIVAFSIYMIL